MNQNILPKDHPSLLNVRFVKNEEGKREAQQITEQEIESDTSKKGTKVILVGHVGHTQTEIIELLNRHSEKINAEIVVIEPQTPQYGGSLEVLVQERREQVLISIEKTCREMSDIFFEAKRKPQHSNIYYTPKIQRAKIQTKRYIPIKK